MQDASCCYHGAMAMPRLLIATNNTHKVAEFRRLLDDVGYELVIPSQVGLALAVIEDAATFQANASLKGVAHAAASGLPSLADDSGIEVDALGGGPGIRSARYGGPRLSDEGRVRLLLHELRDVPWERRGCRYVTALVIAWPSGRQEVFEGACQGVVTFAPVGVNGFGYDPIFHVPEAGRTMAELSAAQKDAISHRGLAAWRAAAVLRRETASVRE